MTSTKKHWLASCPKGLEQLLANELSELGASDIRETVAGVYFQGELQAGYRIYLWSRLANRLLLQLGQYPADDADGLYEGAKKIDWSQHFGPEKTFAVRFSGSSREINHTRFGARRVKDAVVDCFRENCGRRPDVDARQPDIWIHAHLTRKGDKGTVRLALDFGGESLHRRRYRSASVPAPLKENLASALLIRSGWRSLMEAEQPGSCALIDPMCGSGTLLIEAALMATDTAPGVLRDDAGDRHGFSHWLGHNAEAWAELLAQARQRRSEGMQRQLPEIRGYDCDGRAVRAAQENIERAGLDGLVRVAVKPVAELKQPTHTTFEQGLVICNPPYGERLGEEEALRTLYYQLGERLKTEFPGWQAAVFTGNPGLGPEMNLRAHKQYQLFNGAIPCKLLLFAINEKSANSEPRTNVAREPEALSDGALMFANRLKKNQRKFKSWLKRENVQCYRLYDADMPEYAVAADIYRSADGDSVHLQEYDPPKTIDERDARRRLRETRQGLMEALQLEDGQLFFKQRKRQKGNDQYQVNKSQANKTPDHNRAVKIVQEGPAKFEVNLQDYLDTGLFLDHRPLRRLVAAQARGKSVLNLFCYTASITVQAALAGARQSLSVDMSQTYLDWAKRQF